MKESVRLIIFAILISFFASHTLSAIVGPVLPGQSLWCINKRIASEVDNIESKLDNLCHATMITGPTTITQEGAYCLGNTITGAITIAASNVELDLSNRRVTQGITINSGLNQVTVRNGVVEGSANAILANGGSRAIAIEGVTAKNAICGINFQGVTDGWITNCEMVLNTTGLELDNSHNIIVQNCMATRNIHAGYSLVSSTTNTFENCQALSTGVGNSDVTNTTVCGFTSLNGYGNIFERCIANSTQALSTTDANSLIAGFALRGSEGCSKIISCEATNGMTAAGGVTVPYGIILPAQFDGLTTVTSLSPGTTSDNILTVDWSPDGKYVACAGIVSSSAEASVFVYKFNRTTQGLVRVSSVLAGNSSDQINVVQWSPDGRFLAVGGDIDGTIDNGLHIYQFSSVTEKLTEILVAALPTGFLTRTIGWSPDGKYIALGATTAGAGIKRLFVVRFDPVTETLTSVAAVNPDEGTLSDVVLSVDWSPDGQYLAVGGALGDTTGNDLIVYKFNPNNNNLTQVASVNPDGGSTGDAVAAVQWSPDGNYLAIGGDISGGSNNDVFVYRFNRTTNTLTEVASVNPDGGATNDAVGALSWSPDGKYLVVGGTINGTTNNDLFVYQFDPGVETLTQVASSNPDSGAEDTVNAVSWSPDGQYIVIGGNIAGTTNNDVIVYRVLRFPFDNVITKNTLYCNSGNKNPGGVGISASSICNFIVDNKAYSNPLNPPIVGSNYQFVTNLFSQTFGSVPSPLQNISINSCEPICNPENLVLLVQQNINKTDHIIDLLACGPTALTAANISGGTISITASGNYCLETDLTTDITITASCVSLELNNRCLTGKITISGNTDIEVKNGFVKPPAPSVGVPAGITVAASATHVTIEDVTVECADTSGAVVDGRSGISVAGNDVQVLNCTVTSGSADISIGSGAAGGDGIVIADDANRALVKGCVILATGNGGANSSGDGGRAGHGIAVGVTGIPAFTEISECIVFSTGTGGDGNGGGNGGDGGHAVYIGASAVDTSVRNCTFRNTGFGGAGAVAGTDGRAVNDLQVTAGDLSMIFSNFAHNIANSVKYNIQNTGLESGILTPNPPTSTVINPLANVYAS